MHKLWNIEMDMSNNYACKYYIFASVKVEYIVHY